MGFFLAFYLTYLLAFYRKFILAFIVEFYLAPSLASILMLYLAFYLECVLTFYHLTLHIFGSRHAQLDPALAILHCTPLATGSGSGMPPVR